MWRKVVLGFLLICVIGLSYKVFDDSHATFEVDNTLRRVTVDEATPIYYEVKSDNTMKCDLAAFSLVVKDMTEDGFAIKTEDNTEELIDVVLVKDDTTVRMRYTANGEFASISDPFERSYLPITYINEKSVQD